MYGVSKIHIEPNLMMISVQDAEFKDNTMARYLQIFADTGVVVDMSLNSASCTLIIIRFGSIWILDTPYIVKHSILPTGRSDAGLYTSSKNSGSR